MQERLIHKFRPGLERLEEKKPLSAGVAVVTAHGTRATLPATAEATGSSRPAATDAAGSGAPVSATAVDPKPTAGFLLYRITNPTIYNNHLIPPFTNFFVQTKQPIPGQVYNILYVAVRNGTKQTFGANSNFFVRFPDDPHTYSILSGTQTWKPGQEYVFYVLSKQYYPLPSQVHSGFDFSLAGARSVGIPGPSGIILRIKYNPATFDQILDREVAYGPGNQGGKGAKYGLPNTAIDEFVSAKTNRNDFAGYF